MPSTRPLPISRMRSRRWRAASNAATRVDAARRDGHRQDDDDGGDDRGRPAPGLTMAHNKTLAAQLCNEFRTYFPTELRRVLRLLLRLLPARGLRPVAGPLHREGLGDQPGDRPAASRRHGLAVRPSRRDHRGGASPASSASARRRPTTRTARSSSRARTSTATSCCASSCRCSTTATTRRSGAARSACAARRWRSSRPMRRRPSGCCCSATRSSACSTSTR